MTGNSAPILIIDDDADIRDVLKIVLEANGYCVRLASDGLDGLAKLQTGTPPAMILLDLMMPRMDGEQFMEQMRAKRLGEIPVVIMSGNLPGGKSQNQFGAASCLNKPVEYNELLKTVRQFAPAHSSD